MTMMSTGEARRGSKTLLRTVPAVAAVTALALTACASDEAADFEDGDVDTAGQTEPAAGTENDDAEAATDSDSEGESDPDDESGSENGAEQEDDGSAAEDEPASPVDESRHPDNAQQVVTYPLPEVEGEMTMGLQSLTANEQGLLLSVSFVPDYDDETEDGPLTMFELHGPDGISGHNAYLLPTLSDRQNFKQYYVPTPDLRHRAQGWAGRSADAWATQLEGFGLTSGEVFSLWAYFPVPEDDIDVIDVAVMPGAPEFQSVEIDWGDVQPGAGSAEDAEDDDAEGSAEDDE